MLPAEVPVDAPVVALDRATREVTGHPAATAYAGYTFDGGFACAKAFPRSMFGRGDEGTDARPGQRRDRDGIRAALGRSRSAEISSPHDPDVVRGDGRVMPESLAIRGATIVTMDDDRAVIPEGTVVIRGGRFVAVGRRARPEGRPPHRRAAAKCCSPV